MHACHAHIGGDSPITLEHVVRARDGIVLLAVHRMEFLTLEEKLLVSDLYRDQAGIRGLTLADLRVAICRTLARVRWDAAAAIAVAESDARMLERHGWAYVHHDDAGYPPALRETTDPPFGLFVRGSLPDPTVPAAAVVGTRSPSECGMEAAARLAAGLARVGIPVLSGLARGIDAAAHSGSMGAGGYTMAVLPCGIDRIYPPSNRRLAAAILDSAGALVSEYSPGGEIHKYRFPERNRLIAGMARACVVVEAPGSSGALITAAHALDEGRDVWVHRNCLGGPRNAGGDRLHGEGAPALSGASDLLADWGWRAPPDTTCGTGHSACSRRSGTGADEPDPAEGEATKAGGSAGVGRRLARGLARELRLQW